MSVQTPVKGVAESKSNLLGQQESRNHYEYVWSDMLSLLLMPSSRTQGEKESSRKTRKGVFLKNFHTAGVLFGKVI